MDCRLHNLGVFLFVRAHCFADDFLVQRFQDQPVVHGRDYQIRPVPAGERKRDPKPMRTLPLVLRAFQKHGSFECSPQYSDGRVYCYDCLDGDRHNGRPGSPAIQLPAPDVFASLALHSRRHPRGRYGYNDSGDVQPVVHFSQ